MEASRVPRDSERRYLHASDGKRSLRGCASVCLCWTVYVIIHEMSSAVLGVSHALRESGKNVGCCCETGPGREVGSHADATVVCDLLCDPLTMYTLCSVRQVVSLVRYHCLSHYLSLRPLQPDLFSSNGPVFMPCHSSLPPTWPHTAAMRQPTLKTRIRHQTIRCVLLRDLDQPRQSSPPGFAWRQR